MAAITSAGEVRLHGRLRTDLGKTKRGTWVQQQGTPSRRGIRLLSDPYQAPIRHRTTVQRVRREITLGFLPEIGCGPRVHTSSQAK